jgi:hypothetical protein
MKWVKKWGSYLSQWAIESDMVAAMVTQAADGSFSAWHQSGNLDLPAGTTVEAALAAVEGAIADALRHALSALELGRLPVEDEGCPVEPIPGSQGKLGYGDGWLRVKKGRAATPAYVSDLILDDGRTAHIHPFIAADEEHAAAIPGVTRGDRIAGVRWFDR